MEVFLDLPRLDDLGVCQLQRRATVAVHASFFIDEQRQSRLGARARAIDDEQIGGPHAAAATDPEHCHEAEREARPHTLTATPPRLGSPAPVEELPLRWAA